MMMECVLAAVVLTVLTLWAKCAAAAGLPTTKVDSLFWKGNYYNVDHIHEPIMKSEMEQRLIPYEVEAVLGIYKPQLALERVLEVEILQHLYSSSLHGGGRLLPMPADALPQHGPALLSYMAMIARAYAASAEVKARLAETSRCANYWRVKVEEAGGPQSTTIGNVNKGDGNGKKVFQVLKEVKVRNEAGSEKPERKINVVLLPDGDLRFGGDVGRDDEPKKPNGGGDGDRGKGGVGGKENGEDEEEDRYRLEGSVELRIEHFTNFVRQQALPGEPLVQRLSEKIYVGGLPWRILAILREVQMHHRRHRMEHHRRQMGQVPPKALGFFLQCNGEVQDPIWSCQATATLSVLSQQEGVPSNVRRIRHSFYAKENDWGFSQYLTSETLLDPNNPWIKDDTIILRAEIQADAPHGAQCDNKKHTDHIGLKNQGATCYMNSILQMLFFTNKLRKAVYMMPTEKDDPENSVALAMQRVFYELQFSGQPVDTKKLTKSFGWDSIDSFLQHDVQELCRVLLDNLESKMKQTVVADTIPLLFRGRMKSYIKCKNIDFESSREEFYYDVQLNVNGKQNILESFRDYTRAEVLDGDNKYDAGDNGMQDAEKGVKFLTFPPVLHLQLMRFQYEPTLGANVKINDRFEFPEKLQLNEFIDEAQGQLTEDYTYLLHAVLVHSGDFHGGHYVVFINTNLRNSVNERSAEKWCKFDDNVVSRVAVHDAVASNFGEVESDPEMNVRQYVSAYMLVYVRKSEIDDVLGAVATEDIPTHLTKHFEMEKEKEAQRKQEKDEEKHYCEVTLVTDEHMLSHHGFELFDPKSIDPSYYKPLRVEKKKTIRELYERIAEKMGMDPRDFRLWSFNEPKRDQLIHHVSIDDNELRPHKLLQYSVAPFVRHTQQLNKSNGSDDGMDTDENIVSDFSYPDAKLDCNSTWKLYLEGPHLSTLRGGVAGEGRHLPPISASKRLCFVKFYNTERDVCEYKGPIFLDITQPLYSHKAEIAQMVGHPDAAAYNRGEQLQSAGVVGPPQILHPSHLYLTDPNYNRQAIAQQQMSHPFSYWVEVAPDDVTHVPPAACTPLPIKDAFRQLTNNGSILVVKLKEKSTAKRNAKTYFKQLFNRVDVEAVVNTELWPLLSTNTPALPVRGTLGQDWSYERVCQWLGGEINYDHQKLILCQTNPATDRPTNQLMRSEELRRLLQLNPASHDPRQPRCHKLYYVKLPFRLSDWEMRKPCKLQALSYAHHFRYVAEITVFPDKLGTAQTLLDEAKREFDFAMATAEQPYFPSNWSTGVLRLVYYSASALCTRVYSPPIKPEMTIAEMYANIRNMATPIWVRIEEVPEDQLEVRQNEWLMPVAHYDKELNRMFGMPFLVKVSHGEPYRQIKKRIQEILDVNDKEFEKYKFFLVSNNRIGRELNEGTVNLQELNASHYTSTYYQPAPFLGIDHMNKSRGMRGGHGTEKAIVIHN